MGKIATSIKAMVYGPTVYKL